MTEKTFAEQMADDAELLRRRHVHATRPRGPLSMDQARDLADRLAGAQTFHLGDSIHGGAVMVPQTATEAVATRRIARARLAEQIERQLRSPTVPPQWDDFEASDWRLIIDALRRS